MGKVIATCQHSAQVTEVAWARADQVLSVARDHSLKLWGWSGAGDDGGGSGSVQATSNYVTGDAVSTHAKAIYPNTSRYPNLSENTLSHDPMCVAVAGDVAVTGGGSCDALVWELTSGEPRPTATLEAHRNNVTGVCLIEWEIGGELGPDKEGGGS